MTAGRAGNSHQRLSGDLDQAGAEQDDPPQPLSLDQVYRSESRWLLHVVARRAGSQEEARDIVQEAFLRLARIGRDFSGGIRSPRGYLHRIAINLLRDRAKTAARRSAGLHVVADEGELPGVDPHALLESRDMLNRLEKAMMRLKPKTREIFVAHRIEGLSYAEIAERTGLSVHGVEKQMSKALARLDRLLELG